jgi:hypothetical protein
MLNFKIPLEHSILRSYLRFGVLNKSSECYWKTCKIIENIYILSSKNSYFLSIIFIYLFIYLPTYTLSRLNSFLLRKKSKIVWLNCLAVIFLNLGLRVGSHCLTSIRCIGHYYIILLYHIIISYYYMPPQY